jgi:predicted RNase H-like HicB family nuclease
MILNYICYDGVDQDITFHKTREEALDKLKELIDNGLEDGEWMDDVEHSFVAK